MFSPSFAIVNTPLLYTAPPIPPALLFTNLVALIVKCPLFVIAPPSLVQELFVNSQFDINQVKGSCCKRDTPELRIIFILSGFFKSRPIIDD